MDALEDTSPNVPLIWAWLIASGISLAVLIFYPMVWLAFLAACSVFTIFILLVCFIIDLFECCIVRLKTLIH